MRMSKYIESLHNFFPKVRPSVVLAALALVGCGSGGTSTSNAINDTDELENIQSEIQIELAAENFQFPNQFSNQSFSSESQLIISPNNIYSHPIINIDITNNQSSISINYKNPINNNNIFIDFDQSNFISTIFNHSLYFHNKNESNHLLFIGRPIDTGLNYSSYGVWLSSDADNINNISILSSYFGFKSDLSLVPTTGSARFDGSIIGYQESDIFGYVEVGGDLALNVDFDRQTFLGDVTSVQRVIDGAPEQWENFIIQEGQISNGNLTASMNGNDLSGSLIGEFFGPSAEEIGINFQLNSSVDSSILIGSGAASR